MGNFAAIRDASVPEVLHKAWERVDAQWDDTTAHDELIRLVTQNSAYAWAAAKYRDRTDDIGKAQLDRVRKAAEVTMMHAATVRPAKKGPSPYRSVALLLAVLVALAIAGLVYTMAVRNRHPTATPPSTPPTVGPTTSPTTAPSPATAPSPPPTTPQPATPPSTPASETSDPTPASPPSGG